MYIQGHTVIAKKYLTFNELLLRWNCEKNEIHHFIENSMLVPSIAWNKYGVKCEWESDSINDIGLFEVGDGSCAYERYQLSDWLYLRLPKPKGAYQYSFAYGTIESLPKAEELRSGTWFHLLNDEYYNSIASIQSQRIESDAVFMIEKVEFCESLHPELLIATEKKIKLSVEKVESTDKPLSTRTENNYLRLIFKLANGISGFNHKKPYEAAQLIINKTGIDISQETLAGYITKAYELECKSKD